MVQEDHKCSVVQKAHKISEEKKKRHEAPVSTRQQGSSSSNVQCAESTSRRDAKRDGFAGWSGLRKPWLMRKELSSERRESDSIEILEPAKQPRRIGSTVLNTNGTISLPGTIENAQGTNEVKKKISRKKESQAHSPPREIEEIESINLNRSKEHRSGGMSYLLKDSKCMPKLGNFVEDEGELSSDDGDEDLQ